MRKSILLTSLLTLFTVAGAQSQPLSVGTQGSKAILFNFAGLSALNLTAYQGGLGGKYFISNGLVVRALLLFGIDNSTTKSSPQFTDDKLSFGIGGGLEYHLPLASNVSPYVGGALSFVSSARTTNPGANKTSTTAFGLGALGGVEYFFNQNISLSAEYQFGLTTTSTSTSGAPDYSEFQLGFQTAGLTMGVYF